MQVRNLFTFPREIDHEGTTYHCAARPGTVDVPAKLARSLADQDGWDLVEEKDTGKDATTTKEGEG